MSSPTVVSRSIDIPDTTPTEVFDWLTDTANHAANDGSGHVVGPVGPATLSAKGDEFGMKMKWVVPYTITNTVVEFDRDSRLAWRHMAGHRWRYELEAIDSGTRVTESFDIDRIPKVARPVYSTVFGFPESYASILTDSLHKLRETLTESE